MLAEIAVDGGLEVGDGFEGAAPNALSGQGGEEVFHCIEPRARGGGEVEDPTRMAAQPFVDLWVLVGGVVVEDGMDDLAGADLALDPC